MNLILLLPSNNFILKPLAWILSKIIDVIYMGVHVFTTSHCMVISIILFTFIVRAILMPLTLKQQRSSRKMQRVQPQIAKIQEKYQGKTDPESNQRMSAEMQEVYSKNKTSPFTGCLPLLIQMPILFAMYEVLRNLPFYISDLNEIYTSMAEMVMNVSGYETVIEETYADVVSGLSKFDVTSVKSVIDFMGQLSRTEWVTFMEDIGLSTNAAFTALQAEQQSINAFFTFNLCESPGWKIPGIIWPLLAGGTTWLQSWLMQRSTDKRQRITGAKKSESEKQQDTTMKMMNIVFPVMMAFIVVSTPLGLGVYWIASNLFSLIQQFVVDKIIEKEEYEDALRRRDEYEEKKRLKEIAKSSIDQKTGKRVGTAESKAAKSSMAGNKKAAMRIEQEGKKKDGTGFVPETVSSDSDSAPEDSEA